ncbi:LegK7 family Dot/Icm T4SS effector kinase [Legionella cherrii]|uniref:Protein kinase domain containing protein n=1 Tax=Legionella cherrii TaxID=28084 RepID=A0ABY6T8C7_9GAMM|nr:LegK7 family Dot/Icm T4SS effector kinase [Legionella cherrii]VEB38289.1 protein kinase domain containing protein [Legionella cherrii]
MGLTVNPLSAKYRKLIRLIHEFNKIAPEDVVQRLFYLQKINYSVNSIRITEGEYHWLSATDEDSWQAHLLAYGINPDGAFLYKGIQFAKAVAAQSPVAAAELPEQNDTELYKLMKERDALLKGSQPFAQIKEQFVTISKRLSLIAEHDKMLKQNLDDHTRILELAKEKISAIKGEIVTCSSAYKTEVLGDEAVNNYNFTLEMSGWDKTLVLSVVDRSDLSDQDLYSDPVSKYFANDTGLFMMQFKSEDQQELEYRPVVLSQYANQGNLLHVAKSLKGESQETIAARAKFHFNQINDFCLKLKEAGYYHPDIKLSNFLAHNYKLVISDRKTFVNSPNPLASGVRASPRYAPPEYLVCINEENKTYYPAAYKTHLNVEQLMSYQLGMALKEFLIATQVDKLPDLRKTRHRTALSYFRKPGHAITNLSTLIEELTRPEVGKRLSINQFQELLFLINNPAVFHKKLEIAISSETLGIQKELKEIQKLLASDNLEKGEFLEKADAIFTATSEREPKEPRLNRMAEQLATKCYQKYSKEYFSRISQDIEDALLTEDWVAASWWRQAIHFLSFGFFRVDRVTPVDKIKIALDYNDPTFRTHFIQLEFLPAEELDDLGITESNNFQDYFEVHLEEIRALNTTNSDSESDEADCEEEAPESPKDREGTSAKSSEIRNEETPAESSSFQTVVVKKNSSKKAEAPVASQKSADGTLPSEPQKSTPPQEKPQQHKKKTSVGLAESQHFFANYAKLSKAVSSKKRVASIHRIGSTLFRGEQRTHHPRIQDVFEPLTQEKKPEPSVTTTGLVQ